MTYFSISRTKRGVCPVCGKEAQRQITFYGSEYEGEPNADGSTRTVRQLEAELEAKADAWEKLPALHMKCENRKR